MDPETGKCVWTKEQLEIHVKMLQKYIVAAHQGTFIPDRENDELTEALGNPEHPDGHEARQAPFCGRLDFPPQAVTNAGIGRTKRS